MVKLKLGRWKAIIGFPPSHFHSRPLAPPPSRHPQKMNDAAVHSILHLPHICLTPRPKASPTPVLPLPKLYPHKTRFTLEVSLLCAVPTPPASSPPPPPPRVHPPASPRTGSTTIVRSTTWNVEGSCCFDIAGSVGLLPDAAPAPEATASGVGGDLLTFSARLFHHLNALQGPQRKRRATRTASSALPTPSPPCVGMIHVDQHPHVRSGT